MSDATTIGDVLAARAAAGRTLRLWSGPGMAWVAEDEERALCVFDADSAGWAQRKPWEHSTVGLQEVAPYNAAGTGWVGLEMPQ